ncbi:MAG: hypothetical protein ACKOAY_11560, partial [Haliscomenobacter sp.]
MRLFPILSWAFFWLANVPAISARTLEVGPAATFQAIQPALDAAEKGDTVRVQPGRYIQNTLLIRTSIVLLGIGHPVLEAPKG